MMLTIRRLAVGAIAAIAMAMPGIAAADGDRDHDRARDLYEHGEIHALREILAIVEQHVPGDVVAVDLIRLNDAWVYRFQVVSADGHRVIVDIDAGAGKFLGALGED